MGNILIELLFIFYQKREKLHDEEERKSAWVSQERQRTLDRLRTFKQVIKVHCFVFHCYIHTTTIRFLCMRKTGLSLCCLESN